MQLPAASANVGMQLSESVNPPAGVRGVMARTVDASSGNTPYLYFSLVSSDAVTLSGTLGYTLTVPSNVPAQQQFYLAALFSDGTWGTIAGPASPVNGTLSLGTKLTLTYPGTPNAAFVMALYAGSPVYSGAPIVVQPASIALMDLSATQTLTIGGSDPSATYSVDASQCSGISTATQASATTYTVGAVALGTCNLIVSDNHGNSLSVFVSVTSTSVVIQ